MVHGAYPRISNLDPPAPSITDQAAAIWKAMAEMVKLQVTERVERTEDKENGTNESVNRGMVYLRPVGRPYGSFTVYWKAVRFIYGLSEGRMVHSRPVRRPYGSFTARRKAVRFILRTISRTHGQLGAPFRRQPRRYLGRDFLRISFMFYGFTSYVFHLCFTVLLKQLRRLYTCSFIFQIPPVSDYINAYLRV